MDVSDPYFERIYNKRLLRKLEDRFGPIQRHHVELSIATRGMLDLANKMNYKNRRGEVVMVVPNEEGRIWLHTKAFYPKGIYRLMTGGLDPGEKPRMALAREVKEETGFTVNIDRCLAAITYDILADDLQIPFVSYIFLTEPGRGDPKPVDASEKISDFKAVKPAKLMKVARKLRAMDDYFADWGRFRAVAHEVAGELLDHK